MQENEFHHSFDYGSISARIEEDVVELVAIFVHQANRHNGIGRQLFDVLVSSIPSHVTRIELNSMPDADGFWRKLGFTSRYLPNSDPDFDIPNLMVIGCNGHPTPAPIEFIIDENDAFSQYYPMKMK